MYFKIKGFEKAPVYCTYYHLPPHLYTTQQVTLHIATTLEMQKAQNVNY